MANHATTNRSKLAKLSKPFERSELHLHRHRPRAHARMIFRPESLRAIDAVSFRACSTVVLARPQTGSPPISQLPPLAYNTIDRGARARRRVSSRANAMNARRECLIGITPPTSDQQTLPLPLCCARDPTSENHQSFPLETPLRKRQQKAHLPGNVQRFDQAIMIDPRPTSSR